MTETATIYPLFRISAEGEFYARNLDDALAALSGILRDGKVDLVTGAYVFECEGLRFGLDKVGIENG